MHQIVTVQLLVTCTDIDHLGSPLIAALERLKKAPENNGFISDFRIDSGDCKFVAENAPADVVLALHVRRSKSVSTLFVV